MLRVFAFFLFFDNQLVFSPFFDSKLVNFYDNWITG